MKMWKSATTLHIVLLNTPMHILSPPSPPLTSHQTVKQGGKESWEGKRDFCFMLCCSLIPFDYLVDAFFPLAPPPLPSAFSQWFGDDTAQTRPLMGASAGFRT